jgi:hypothetical protein
MVGNIGVTQAASVISNRKTSTVSDVKGKDKHHQGSLAGAKTGINTSSIDGATGSQVILIYIYFFTDDLKLILSLHSDICIFYGFLKGRIFFILITESQHMQNCTRKGMYKIAMSQK